MKSDENETRKAAPSDLDEKALFFHQSPVPGKLEIRATKPLGNQRDLALAYSPGVAAAPVPPRSSSATTSRCRPDRRWRGRGGISMRAGGPT